MTKTKVWDTRKTDAPVFSASNNIKSVNRVWVSEEDNRLFTGSVDCHLKVYELEEVCAVDSQFKVVNQFKYKSAVTGFAFTEDMSHLCVGLADGTVQVTKHKGREKKIEVRDESAFLLNIASNEQALDYKYFFRGIYGSKPKVQSEDTIEMKKGIRLAKYDACLK